MDIRWTVGISYTDVYENRLFAQYKLNARNRNIAEDIAKELFMMEIGVFEITGIIVEPEHLTSEDMRRMLEIKDTVIEQLNKSFRGSTYRDFTLAFQQFDGFSATLTSFGESSFWLNFLEVTVKAVYTITGECYIDTKEVYYRDETGRKIVARNSWTEFYYCS